MVDAGPRQLARVVPGEADQVHRRADYQGEVREAQVAILREELAHVRYESALRAGVLVDFEVPRLV